jgi:anti-sigma factor RsiW
MVQTFFDGSPTSAVAALLEMADGELSAPDRARLAKMIAQAKAEGK